MAGRPFCSPQMGFNSSLQLCVWLKSTGEMTRIPVIRNQELAYEFRKTRCYLHFWIAPQTHRSSVWLTFNPKTDNKSKHLIAATARTPWFARRWWCRPGSRLRRESDSNCLGLCWFGLHAKIPAITEQIQSHKLSRDCQKSDRIFSIDFLKHGLWQRLRSYLYKIENFIFRRPF